MGDNHNLEWEKIQTSFTDSMSPRDNTYRSKIHGGWLVRYVNFGGAGKNASAIIFIADAKSEWTIDKGKELWQAIDMKRSPNDDLKIYRMIVPGGWIVREGYFTPSRQSYELKLGHLSLTMTFVPDNQHKWTLEEREAEIEDKVQDENEDDKQSLLDHPDDDELLRRVKNGEDIL